jgi:hypothetical protein
MEEFSIHQSNVGHLSYYPTISKFIHDNINLFPQCLAFHLGHFINTVLLIDAVLESVE